jgi:hypothetical protein
MSSARRMPFAAVCLLWAGIVIGVAFAEAMKFRTPTLTRSVASDVGRTVFRASHWLQEGLLFLALATAFAGRVPRWVWGCLALVGAAFLLQGVWVFPVLDARAQTVIAGGVPAGASPHAAYMVLEALKLLGLVAAAVLALQPPRHVPGA